MQGYNYPCLHVAPRPLRAQGRTPFCGKQKLGEITKEPRRTDTDGSCAALCLLPLTLHTRTAYKEPESSPPTLSFIVMNSQEDKNEAEYLMLYHNQEKLEIAKMHHRQFSATQPYWGCYSVQTSATRGYELCISKVLWPLSSFRTQGDTFPVPSSLKNGQKPDCRQFVDLCDFQ